MKILLADSNHPIVIELLTGAGFTCDLLWDKPKEELIKLLPSYDAIIIRSKFKITKEIIDTCPNLKCIGRVGAGMENIDVAYATAKGIDCLSVPEGNMDAVGEHALGMLLMLLNNLKKADGEVRKGVWIRAENRGTEIGGKVVALIGFGYMGSAFAKKLSGLGCEIIAYDKYKTGFGNSYVKEVQMAEIFERADMVSLHLPETKETTYLAQISFFNAFAKPIYLVNTARGKCVNTADLVTALETKKVLGACLDVLEYESVSFESIDATNFPEPFKYLIESDKVVLSPHVAGWTHESNFKMSKIIAEKMVASLKLRT